MLEKATAAWIDTAVTNQRGRLADIYRQWVSVSPPHGPKHPKVSCWTREMDVFSYLCSDRREMKETLVICGTPVLKRYYHGQRRVLLCCMTCCRRTVAPFSTATTAETAASLSTDLLLG